YGFMRKILCIVLLALYGGAVLAQNAEDSIAVREIEAGNRNFQQIFDSLAQNLDYLRVPQGMLANRVFLGAEMANITPGDTISSDHIRQLVFNMDKAALPNLDVTPVYEDLMESNKQLMLKSRLPIVVLDYTLSKISED